MHRLVNQNVEITFNDTTTYGVVLGFSEGFLILGEKEGDTPRQYINIKNITTVQIVDCRSTVTKITHKSMTGLTQTATDVSLLNKLEILPSEEEPGRGTIVWKTNSDSVAIRIPNAEWSVFMSLVKGAGKAVAVSAMAAEIQPSNERQLWNALHALRRRLKIHQLGWFIVHQAGLGYSLSKKVTLIE